MAIQPNATQPLDQRFPITDQRGHPSDYFMRYLFDRNGALTDVDAELEFLRDSINGKADKTTTISAGTGLSGGGDLSANRTISLANTAVTPGSYTSTNLTVDAQGRITAAANGSGGGGGSWTTKASWSFSVSGAISTLTANITGSADLMVIVSDVTMALTGWRTVEFSEDGGLTWITTGNPLVGITNAGVTQNPGPLWFLHATTSNLARSAMGLMYGMSSSSEKSFMTPRDSWGLWLRTSPITHVRVSAYTTAGGPGSTTFTGGLIRVLAR